MNARSIAVAALAISIVAIPATAIASRPIAPSEVIGALSGSRETEDWLSPATASNLAASELRAEEAQLLRRVGQVSHFVVPNGRGEVCLVAVVQTPEGEVSASGCNGAESVQASGMPLSLIIGGDAYVAVLSPDGYLGKSSELDVADNLSVFEGPAAQVPTEVLLQAADGRTISVPIATPSVNEEAAKAVDG